MDPLGSDIQDLPGFTGQNRKSDSLGFRGSCGIRNKKAPQSKQCILVYNRKGYDAQTIGTLAPNPKPCRHLEYGSVSLSNAYAYVLSGPPRCKV